MFYFFRCCNKIDWCVSYSRSWVLLVLYDFFSTEISNWLLNQWLSSVFAKYCTYSGLLGIYLSASICRRRSRQCLRFFCMIFISKAYIELAIELSCTFYAHKWQIQTIPTAMFVRDGEKWIDTTEMQSNSLHQITIYRQFYLKWTVATRTQMKKYWLMLT